MFYIIKILILYMYVGVCLLYIIYIKYQIDLHKKHKCKDTLFIVGL